ncbi:MAG: FadR/GntR family transcriptional regulator [Rhodoglobus sp.]|uniref:FadR/GntR family transcriptional regulator n=1 Tax=Salinibacterium sp. G-O1 TaxID=3046208 RepID=UPI0024BAF0CE|nr:FCD domain-containing protein [Salinibacterium sp. G-O1]MDJ0335955.1 FCD domain-containing protein [Salinibacterium sp. G-O1]
MPKAPRTGSHELVLHELGRRITAGEIPEGTVLTLAGLEAEFAASRTVIREAVRVLESLGMLRSRRRVGVTVQARPGWKALDGAIVRWNLAGEGRREQLLSLMELRSAVEPAAARLAAERASATDRRQLSKLADKLDALGIAGKGDSAEYLDVDVEFHRLLLTSGGNPLLAQLSGPVEEVLRGRAGLGLTPAIPADGTLEHHVATARAVAAGDPDAAETSARGYVTIVTEEVRAQ